ncbi:hypothetical protein T4E_9515 [Trichinella pseudospiralis]|uniref:Uncharacterized protein n=1 Tax=Trichinella pseudospiralis TaxID=6337 RepID=A0A0V0XJH1_TRIPS|nr:hypothetical protein T4E_9515 [Trichinella pseudospiralis]
MQITIAIMVLYHQNKEWRREKNKNTDNTVQKSIDGTKQIKRKQDIWTMKKRKSENADDTKQIADDTKQIKDDTKQNFGIKTYGICGSPWVPIL